MNTVEAVSYLGEVGEGISKPKKMLCSDGIIRVVKFNHPSHLDRSLLNELLGWNIAKIMELPVLEQSLVEVPAELAKLYSNVEGMSEGIKVGYPLKNINENIASTGLFREPLPKLYGSCINTHHFPGIFIFDMWTQNDDRGSNDGNLLVIPNKNGDRELFVHDYGYCFIRPTSDMVKYKTLEELTGSPLRWQQHYWQNPPVYNALGFHIDLMDSNINPFVPYIKNIENLTIERLDTIMKYIPAEWYISKSEIDIIKNFLYDRRYSVRIEIDALTKSFWFPNWNGGALNWQDLHASSE